MPCRNFLAIPMFLILAGVLLLGASRTNASVFADDHDHDGDDNDHHNTLLVDDDHVQCPNAAFSTIQSAVIAASPGDRINVCPGRYQEQVVITKPLTIQGIAVKNQNLALIQPVVALANSFSLASGNPIAAIVLVDGASKVRLNNLTVDGLTNGINACAPNLVGIYYRNASGDVNNVAVRNIKLGPGLLGCQSGLGIFVQSGNGRKSNVNISGSSVHDYQKNGITANEVGTEVNITGNAVTGIGPSPDIAQNGIQIAFGAKGTIDSNSVINHVYSLCTSANCTFTSSNILIFDSNGVKISRNNTGNGQVNIDYEGDRGEISNNTIFQSPVFDGIALIGNQNRAVNNTIFNSEEAGVFVQGDRNEVNGNTINEAPVGILSDSSSTNSHFDGNKFYNTGFNTVPPSTHAATTLQSLNAAAQGRTSVAARP